MKTNKKNALSLLKVAKVSRSHGLKGELFVRPFHKQSEWPQFDKVFLLSPSSKLIHSSDIFRSSLSHLATPDNKNLCDKPILTKEEARELFKKAIKPSQKKLSSKQLFKIQGKTTEQDEATEVAKQDESQDNGLDKNKFFVFKVQSYKAHKEGFIFKLHGLKAIEQALLFQNFLVFLDKSLFSSSSDKMFYLSELLGFKVYARFEEGESLANKTTDNIEGVEPFDKINDKIKDGVQFNKLENKADGKITSKAVHQNKPYQVTIKTTFDKIVKDKITDNKMINKTVSADKNFIDKKNLFQQVGFIQFFKSSKYQDYLLVFNNKKEILIPFVLDYIQNIDFKNQKIFLKLPKDFPDLDIKT